MLRIGVISAINRYPVKSFAGESLDACKIDTYGLEGDRCHAFFDETKEGWDSFFTARDIPDMLSYKAKYIGDFTGSGIPRLKITSPEGRDFGWDDDLLTEMQRNSKKKMLMRSYQTQNPDLKAVDEGSILIITDTSLRLLEEIWGKQLDERRFRANIVVKAEGSGYSEKDWIGKRLSIGSAQLYVDKYCDRCSMVTLDPDTLERDGSLLRKINEEMNLNFGVYASVEKTGVIHAGDQVRLESP
ncbi:MOSC domain-containing protein [Paenibacillus sp. LPE1-1-1.1]|uniref:MOSC domain-containing protein n=1 Tax=Paenibacillus sp. LPE1-1-1.1 TaxID=3135230 RepID=UPI0034452493